MALQGTLSEVRWPHWQLMTLPRRWRAPRCAPSSMRSSATHLEVHAQVSLPATSVCKACRLLQGTQNEVCRQTEVVLQRVLQGVNVHHARPVLGRTATALHDSLPQSRRLRHGECWSLLHCYRWLAPHSLPTFWLPAGNYAFAKDYDQVVQDTWSIINNQARGELLSSAESCLAPYPAD